MSNPFSRMKGIRRPSKILSNFQIAKQLKLVSKAFKTCYVLVDALDQAEESNDLFELFRHVVNQGNGQFKLLISSRNLYAIRETITSSQNPASLAIISLDSGLMRADVAKFISWKVDALDTRGSGAKEETIRK